MAEIEKMDLKSEDLVNDRLRKLEELMPEAFTESGIDFEKLHLLLGGAVDEGDERYAFTWPGKADAIRQSQTSTTATLRPVVEKSRSRDGEDGSFDSDNLYIEGDNLEVLKLLQRAYHGKVKLIYIDPPYNTGHDFVYRDKFGDTIENYRKQTGQINQSNPETSGRFHSDWCSMMYPRLKLAKELLSDDGVLFVSIDDNEDVNLRKLCDEVFGQNCFVAQAVWQKRTSPDMRKRFSTGHEYLLVYTRKPETVKDAINLLPLSNDDAKNYKNPDDDPNGPWVSSDFTAQGYRPNQMYEIRTPGGAVYTPPEGTCWKNVESEYQRQAAEGRFWYGTDGNGMPRRKTYLYEKEGKNCWTWWSNKEVGHTQEATKELKALFPEESTIFDFPKPVRLLQRVISLGSHSDSLVMDFFSGSATTAEAIMRTNMKNNGSRRFILVQLPEEGPANWNTLCDVGEERIRRVGDRLADETSEANSQLELDEKPKQLPDIGFRVFKLDDSGIEQPKDGQFLIDRIKPGRSDLDIIFEVMLKWGYELTYPIEKAEFAGYECYSVAAGDLICCMESGLTVDALEAIAAEEPLPRRVFIMDSAFAVDDSLKLNALAIFKRVEEQTQQKIELRTV